MGIKNSIHIKLVILLLIFPCMAKAQDVDVKGIVLEHLKDSYSWHVTDIGKKHLSIYLPIIVMDNNGTWHVFSSSHLEHGKSYEGFSIAHEGKYEGKVVTEQGAEHIRPRIDISITKNALSLFINCTILLLIIIPLARWYRGGTMKAPGGFRGMIELVIEYVNNEIIVPCVGEDHRKFSPILLTLFFFILVSNLMGLIPIFPTGANLTGNITITVTLAFCTFLATNLSGTKAYWKEILWPEVPTWLKVPLPIMPAIELLGIFTKPFALMIRLFANIFAGHAVILGLVSIVFITATMGAAISTGMTVVSVFFGVFMLFLELLVAFVQAYVFTLLSSVFIGMARIKHEHH